MNKIAEINDSDLSILSETISIEREEPKQLKVDPIKSIESIQVEEKIDNKQKTEELITKFQDYIKAATEAQKLLGERLINRKVVVNTQKDPMVRDAIRRLFRTDSDIITYEMFQKCLEWRSELLKESRDRTYGTFNGSTRN